MICNAFLLIGVTAVSAFAIQPGTWVHTTEADFSAGETENIVVTNLGDLKLAAATRVIGSVPEQISILYDLQRLGDEVYLAAGPEARLLRQRGDDIEQVLELQGSQVFALSAYEGRLLMGVSGSPSRLTVLREDEPETLIELQNVRYIWDILVNGRAIYLATGTEGQLLRIDLPPVDAVEDGNSGEVPRVSVLLDAPQTNLLCLGRDAKGDLYAGSDTDGLVYRITPNDNGDADTFVLYDAAEPEIAALLVRGDGTVFAGTADADQAKPGRLYAARKADLGRPDSPESSQLSGPHGGIGISEPDEPVMDELEEEGIVPEGEELLLDDESSEPPDIKNDDVAKPDEAEDSEFIEYDNSDEMTWPSRRPQWSPFDLRDELLLELSEMADSGPSTKEQLDRLRSIIKERLLTARNSSELSPLPPKPPVADETVATAQPGQPRASRRPASQPRKKGNAIYRIDPDHIVAEVFRESVMILQIAEDQGSLLVATGNEGQIYRVDPDKEETTVLVDLESQQVPALLEGEDRILLGTANPAALVSLDRGFAGTGMYTSDVLDAAQVSQWGTLHLTARLVAGSRIQVEVRSGNVADTDQAGWSDWTEPIVIDRDVEIEDLAPRELPIGAPSARFLQYRLTLTTEGTVTPVIDKLSITYVVPNLKPRITELKTRYADQRTTSSQAPPILTRRTSRAGQEPKHDPRMAIAWKAVDPNRDVLSYRLEYRPGGSSRWLTMAEELTVTNYVWSTHRVPDGHYILRVIASDAAANPPSLAKTATRRSDPVVVDNTPPVLSGDLTARVEKDQARLNFLARDDLSPIRAVHWSLDAADDWQPALPDDMIFDSTSEDLVITIPDLEPGQHVVTVRVTDQRNNVLYKAQVIEVE